MISDADRKMPSKLDRVDWLKKRHYIDERGAWAADVLVADREAAERTLTHGQPQGVRSAGKAGTGIPYARIAARERIEAAECALGPDLTEILSLVVLRNLALPDAAAAMGIHPKAAIPLVRAALQVLAGFYLTQGRL